MPERDQLPTRPDIRVSKTGFASNFINTLTPRAIINLFHRFLVDAVIVSYPKTGYTWFSVMLRQLILDGYGLPESRIAKLFVQDHRPSQVLGLHYGIPLIYHNHFITKAPAKPDLEDMQTVLKPFRRTPMLIMFRDVKDVLVSYYMEAVHRTEVSHFTGSVDDFARSESYGVTKFVRYYNAVAGFRRRANAPLMIAHYEDMWANTAETLKRTALFLGISNLTDEHITHAIERWSLNNMQRMEDSATIETAVIPDLHVPVTGRSEGRRARVGGTGNWRKHISPDVAAWADDYVARNLDPLYHRPGDTRRNIEARAG